jgi:hypothetical protein
LPSDTSSDESERGEEKENDEDWFKPEEEAIWVKYDKEQLRPQKVNPLPDNPPIPAIIEPMSAVAAQDDEKDKSGLKATDEMIETDEDSEKDSDSERKNYRPPSASEDEEEEEEEGDDEDTETGIDKEPAPEMVVDRKLRGRVL